MPNITQLPVISGAGSQTYFIVVDNKLARRITFDSMVNQITANLVTDATGSSYNLDSLTTSVTTAISDRNANRAVPATSSSIGTTGDMAFTNDFLYICIAKNAWRKIALAAF
jgi:hypothetical protein